MEIDKGLILDKIKDNKWIILVIMLSISLLISGYINYTNYDKSEELKKSLIISKIDEGIADNREILKQIKISIDSLHVVEKYTMEKIDGTQNTIKLIEKQRDEKVKYIYINSVDSTVSLLSRRYSNLSKDSLSR